MGLDMVEIVLETEDQFGISISDEEASKVRTVGAYIDLVTRIVQTQSNAPNREEPFCQTSRAFYRLRRALMQVLPISRQDVTPPTRLDSLIPREKRREIWEQLRKSGVRLPHLQFGLFTGLAIFCLASSPAILWWLWAGNLALLLAAIPLVCVAFRIAQPLRVAVPASCKHVSNAATLLSWHPTVVGSLSREQVAQRIRKLISEQLAMPVMEITDEAEFVKDLNCG